MVCPFCLHKKTSVYNSRPTKRLNGVWRRRRCLACNKEFTTQETVDTETILRVSIGGKKTQPFLRPKLILSLLKVCDHRRTEDDAPYWLYQTIEQRLLKQSVETKGVVTKQAIIEACLIVLKTFDTPAFVKYLAYHSPVLDSRTLKRQLKK